MADLPEFPILHRGDERVRVSRFSPRFGELLDEGFHEKSESERLEKPPDPSATTAEGDTSDGEVNEDNGDDH